MNNHKDDADYVTSYPAYLTFRVNYIDDVFKPMYDKSYTKAKNKLQEIDIYYYNQNNYIRELVDTITSDRLIDDLLVRVPAEGDYIGYALYPSQSGESGLMRYYDYAVDKLILLDNILLWYKNNLSESEFEAFKSKIFDDAARALNKANEMVDAYNRDGSLPLGKNIEDLKEIEAFEKIYNRLEDKIIKVLEKYQTTSFYGTTWNGESLKGVKYASEAVDIILGDDEPRFTVDTVMDHSAFQKALNKAGFTEYDRTDIDEDNGTVTVDAYRRTIRGSIIDIARYFK